MRVAVYARVSTEHEAQIKKSMARSMTEASCLCRKE